MVRTVNEQLLMGLASRITDRDRNLIDLLYAHRVLTTGQITSILFTGQRCTELRLAQLYDLRVIDRFRPRRSHGSAPYHWILDQAGAAVLAAQRGTDPQKLGWVHDKSLALARSQRLGHLVGVNGFFAALHTAKAHPGDHLAQWWSERRCATEWGHLIRPDGYGLYVENGRQTPFLLEYDTGSEHLGQLAAKLDGYTRFARAANANTWILFAFPTPRRETEARRALTATATSAGLTIATATRPGTNQPANPIWLPLNTGPVATNGERHRLAQLPTGPMSQSVA